MRVQEAILRIARRVGMMAFVRDSKWRRRRLLVLCYHGVSRHDEHEWSPELYITPAHLRQRLQFLRDGGYTVLPLADAVQQLYDGTLPARSVALTFDDGTVDFEPAALPILREFDAHAALYLTTYHSTAHLPVFDTMLAYVLWCGRAQYASRVDDFHLFGHRIALRETWRALYEVVERNAMSAPERDQVIATVAAALGVDYAAITARGTMHIMPPETVRTLPTDLVDVQLHTHRRRVPRDRVAFDRELTHNVRAIRDVRGEHVVLDQFCYPSGLYHAEAIAWLRDSGVRSATTCEPALASARSHPLLLPRYVDSLEQSAVTFESWVSGFAELIPRSATKTQIHDAASRAPLRRPWKRMRAILSVRSSA